MDFVTAKRHVMGVMQAEATDVRGCRSQYYIHVFYGTYARRYTADSIFSSLRRAGLDEASARNVVKAMHTRPTFHIGHYAYDPTDLHIVPVLNPPTLVEYPVRRPRAGLLALLDRMMSPRDVILFLSVLRDLVRRSLGVAAERHETLYLVYDRRLHGHMLPRVHDSTSSVIMDNLANLMKLFFAGQLISCTLASYRSFWFNGEEVMRMMPDSRTSSFGIVDCKPSARSCTIKVNTRAVTVVNFNLEEYMLDLMWLLSKSATNVA